jgi:hypothetical protein
MFLAPGRVFKRDVVRADLSMVDPSHTEDLEPPWC